MQLPPTQKSERYIRIASTLCYVQCAFTFLSAIALGMPALATGSANRLLGGIIVVVMLAEALVFGMAARGLRRFRRRSAYLAIGIAAAFVVTEVAIAHSVLNVWLAVNLATVILIVLGWSRFRGGEAEIVAPVA